MKQTKQLTRFLLLVFTLIYAPVLLQAQQNVQLKGRVTDAATNEGIEGVSITVKSTGAGTSTDKQGDFKIAVLKGEKIIISFSGYQQQTITASDNFLSIKLTQDAKQLEDVVVTALGVKKDKRIILNGHWQDL